MAVPQKSPKWKIGREEKSKREKRYCGENGGREERKYRLIGNIG